MARGTSRHGAGATVSHRCDFIFDRILCAGPANCLRLLSRCGAHARPRPRRRYTPTAAHEVPLQLLHERPALLAALLDKLGPETRAARRFRNFFEEQGKREGLADGKHEALLTVLAARGLSRRP